MKVLVIGSGGREHAIVRAICRSGKAEQIFAAPGSSAMGQIAECVPLAVDDVNGIAAFAVERKVNLVVVGPEVAIAAGVSDQLRSHGILVFGPSQAAGELETSKIYSKHFMSKAGVPTAKFVVVESVEATMIAAPQFTPPYVLKADGLAAGKGVFICDTQDELKAAAQNLFDKKELGEAGSKAVLEQFHAGYELSALVLTNGREFQILPMAQDHKRLLEGDKGPNTGGMGTVAPMSVSDELMNQIIERVVKPTLRQLQNEKLLYRGVLFIGLMMTSSGPMVLEYNVRFGDPETQVVLPLVRENWVDIFATIARGEMPKITWNGKSAACVVIASRGYPDRPEKGMCIKGLSAGDSESSYWLHAGTREDKGVWQTAGGRVLNSVAVADTVEKAVELAYQQVATVQFVGMQYRRDIGESAMHRLNSAHKITS